MLTLYQKAFAPTRKLYRIGLVFTQERLWWRDFCDRVKLCCADFKIGFVPYNGVMRTPTSILLVVEENK